MDALRATIDTRNTSGRPEMGRPDVVVKKWYGAESVSLSATLPQATERERTESHAQYCDRRGFGNGGSIHSNCDGIKQC